MNSFLCSSYRTIFEAVCYESKKPVLILKNNGVDEM